MRSTVTPLRSWICNVLAIVFITFAGTLFYFAIDRDPPFVRISGEISPISPQTTIKPGQWVMVTWHLKGDRWCPGMLQRQIIDSKGVVWALDKTPVAFGVSLPVGDFSRRFELPASMAPGRAAYRVTTAYVCNPLHHWWPVVTSGPDIPIDVVP